MNRDTLISDLEHATQIAKEGQDMPLVGGPIGLMWGLLLTIVLAVQYLILEQIIALPLVSLMALWIGFGVIGGIGTIRLSRIVGQKDGAHSVANRVETSVWIMFSAMIGTVVLAVIAAQIFSDATPRLWGLVVLVGFFGQGLAYGTVARFRSSGALAFASIAALFAGAVALTVHMETSVYLIGSIGSFLAIVLPCLIMRRG